MISYSNSLRKGVVNFVPFVTFKKLSLVNSFFKNVFFPSWNFGFNFIFITIDKPVLNLAQFSVYMEMTVSVLLPYFFHIDKPIIHFILPCIMASHVFYFIFW